MSTPKIGIDLILCVLAIATGGVKYEDVHTILTSAESSEALNLENPQWQNGPYDLAEIVRRLLADGKIPFLGERAPALMTKRFIGEPVWVLPDEPQISPFLTQVAA